MSVKNKVFFPKNTNDAFRSSPALFSSDIADSVKEDYLSLLSVGIDDEEAEQRLFSHYKNTLQRGDIDEADFWFALAYVEWKKGRLSDLVKRNAIEFIENGAGIAPWNDNVYEKDRKKRNEILEDLQRMLLSPMPPRKQSRTETGHHCFWRVGDCLAWKLCLDDFQDKPIYNKYALVRVVQVKKEPLCRLAPEAAYNETAVLGVYGWCGDEIPDNDFIKTLKYIALRPDSNKMPFDITILKHVINASGQDMLLESKENIISSVSRKLNVNCTEVIMLCDRKLLKSHVKVIGHDEQYERGVPPFFETEETNIPLSTGYSFEKGLSIVLAAYV